MGKHVHSVFPQAQVRKLEAERWPEVCICSLQGHHGGERQATGLTLQDRVGAGCNKQGFSVSAEPTL